jgi:hypothetical protein
MKPKFRITLCNTCLFDVSDDSSRDRDYCKALGYDAPGGGFRVPPKECPWRHDGVEFEFDEEGANRRYNDWIAAQRESHCRTLLSLRKDAEADGQSSLVKEIDEQLKSYPKEMEEIRRARNQETT